MAATCDFRRLDEVAAGRVQRAVAGLALDTPRSSPWPRSLAFPTPSAAPLSATPFRPSAQHRLTEQS
jgi:hypothetical protein